MTTPYPPAVPPVYRTSSLAIAGFVCSFFCGLVGLILSIMGRNECKRSGGTVGGEGLALAGIIISSLHFVAGVLGIAAAIAIPAFMDTMHKTKRSESELMLSRIEKAAVIYATTNGEFPRGAAPLTPATPCCEGGPDRKCLDVASWQSPAWRELDFSIDDRHRFQYSYESDGKTFTGRAIGDLDCDSSAITYEIRGVIGDSGVPTFSRHGPIGQD
jgi:hypothetical protein